MVLLTLTCGGPTKNGDPFGQRMITGCLPVAKLRKPVVWNKVQTNSLLSASFDPRKEMHFSLCFSCLCIYSLQHQSCVSIQSCVNTEKFKVKRSGKAQKYQTAFPTDADREPNAKERIFSWKSHFENYSPRKAAFAVLWCFRCIFRLQCWMAFVLSVLVQENSLFVLCFSERWWGWILDWWICCHRIKGHDSDGVQRPWKLSRVRSAPDMKAAGNFELSPAESHENLILNRKIEAVRQFMCNWTFEREQNEYQFSTLVPVTIQSNFSALFPWNH